MAAGQARRGRRLAALAVVLLVATGATGWWLTRTRDGSGAVRVPLVTRDVRAPAGQRVRVQVLNATGTRGLARRAMRQLRDAGFDVVEFGTVPAAQRRDSTLVLVRSGHDDWARLVADLLDASARVEARPDSSRYLDVTVLLGATYRPPAETLYP